MRNLHEALRAWLDSGGRAIGEIDVTVLDGGGFTLAHRADCGRGNLENFTGAETARDLAHFDDAGHFRALKTAPNLRRGWRLTVADIPDLRRALDYFYPAMLGVWFSHTCGKLPAVPLRETLTRQTGMYRVTQKVTDVQAQQTVGAFCRDEGGCLKRILWPLAPGQPITTLPAEKFSAEAAPGTLPLLCHEACNLLVAKVREVVKKADQLS